MQLREAPSDTVLVTFGENVKLIFRFKLQSINMKYVKASSDKIFVFASEEPGLNIDSDSELLSASSSTESLDSPLFFIKDSAQMELQM